MTRMGGSWSAPIAIPIVWCPRTTFTLRPVGVLASTQIRSGWRPAAMLASASYSASRTSPKASRTSPSISSANDVGPSRPASYPAASSRSVHRGGIRPAGLPSTMRSTPSIMRPASRPGVRWTARRASSLTRSESILMAFALRGAPCGYRSHRIVAQGTCHPKQSAAGAEPQDGVPRLGPRVIAVLGDQLLFVAPDSPGLVEADAVLSQVGSRLRRVPGFAHPDQRRRQVLPGNHSPLASRFDSLGVTATVQRGDRMIDVASRGGVA